MTDILLDSELDLKIHNGDIATGESTRQHEKCILLSEKGHYREFPFVGVGLQSWLLEDDFSELPEEIQKQYELDGMTVNELQVFTDGSIKTDVIYE